MGIKKYIDSLNYNLKVTDTGEEIYVTHKDWNENEIIFDVTDTLENVKERLNFLEYTFFGNVGCFKDDYFEVLINIPDTYFMDTLIVPSMKHNEKTYFEISTISNILFNSIEAYNSYDTDWLESMEGFLSLKVFNLDKYTDTVNEETVVRITNQILFDLYYKYEIDFKMVVLPEDVYDDPYTDMLDRINEVDDNYLGRNYDKDLTYHYITAKNMVDSQFKYLAYYQVLECVFDEVYLESTIEDVKQIINANWFSKNRNENIAELIGIVDKYNTNRADKEKLRIVLEKYFKGTMHDEAFLKVNKELVIILRDELGKIEKEIDLKDMQKLSTIIYEFRCLCTHSNRAFSVNYQNKHDDLKLESYIKLIRKISEKIILNYSS